MPRKKVTKDNRIQLPDGRYYEDSGKRRPSVTTVLGIVAKPQLIPWAARIERELVLAASVEYYKELSEANEESCRWYLENLEQRIGKQRAHQKQLKEAGDLGTEVHAMVEWELKRELGVACDLDQPVITRPGAQMAYEAWLDWRKQTNLRPVAVEQVVISEKYDCAGTLDLLAYVEDVLSVLDWKSGRSIWPESILQNAAYRSFVREMGIGDPQKGYIVRLPKLDGDGFEVRDAGPEEPAFKAFLAANDLRKAIKEIEKMLTAEKESGILTDGALNGGKENDPR